MSLEKWFSDIGKNEKDSDVSSILNSRNVPFIVTINFEFQNEIVKYSKLILDNVQKKDLLNALSIIRAKKKIHNIFRLDEREYRKNGKIKRKSNLLQDSSKGSSYSSIIFKREALCDCNARTIVSNGLKVCSNCGIVVGKTYDRGLKYYEENNRDQPSTTSMRKEVRLVARDMDYRRLNGRNKARWKRLSKIDKSVSNRGNGSIQYITRNWKEKSTYFNSIAQFYRATESEKESVKRKYFEVTGDRKNLNHLTLIPALFYVYADQRVSIRKLIDFVNEEHNTYLKFSGIYSMIKMCGEKKKPKKRVEFLEDRLNVFFYHKRIANLLKKNNVDRDHHRKFVINITKYLLSKVKISKKMSIFSISLIDYANKLYFKKYNYKRIISAEVLSQIFQIDAYQIRTSKNYTFTIEKRQKIEEALKIR